MRAHSDLCARFTAIGPAGLKLSEWQVPAPTPSLSDELDPWRFTLPHRDPHFSRRHLEVQISQNTDQGARRLEEQAYLLRWLCDAGGFNLAGGHVLQPLCGPGITASAIMATTRVRTYLGLDFGPAPLEHARWLLGSMESFTFVGADVRTWTPPGDVEFDAILLLYEAVNAFSKTELAAMLGRLARRLRPGGHLVCEARLGAVADTPLSRRISWEPDGGLFCPEPHIVLEEAGGLRTGRHAAHQYLIVPLRSGRVEAIHRSTVELYALDEIIGLLTGHGLQVAFQGYPFAHRVTDVPEARNNVVILART